MARNSSDFVHSEEDYRGIEKAMFNFLTGKLERF
jgi:hypothetical protein